VLEDRIKSGDDIILLIVPFIKLAALQQLHRVQTTKVRLKVVCRWRPDDLLAGASDVEIFPYLKTVGCELYLNPDIHLKLYVFASNNAFNTSANLTLRGLGYSEDPNIEIGNTLTLTPGDWERIYRIIAASRQVDDAMYARYKQFVEQNRLPGPGKLPLDLLGKPKEYTIASLPATETPAKLVQFYLTPDHAAGDSEEVRRAIHDLVTFRIPPGLTTAEFDRRLGEAFRKTPFVRDFVELLKQETSLRFGAVNNWIHQKCEDVPLPYRWEIKDNTRIFYDWLAHYFPAINWDRPHHSQVIHWDKK
jgi:hypothetical protein